MGGMMRRVWTAVLLAAIGASALLAQDQLPVALEDPVYIVIELCALRGIIPEVSAVKPYTRRQVREYVSAALEDPGSLSAQEISILQRAREDFSEKPSPASIQLDARSDLRAGLSDPAPLSSMNTADVSLRGGLGPAFSYDVDLGVFYDALDPAALPPFELTKEWDGFHTWFNDAGAVVSNGITSPGIAWKALPVLSLDLLGGAANIQFGRTRREWGYGEGSLSLSGTARPILAVSGDVRPLPWASASFLIGSLGNWWNPAMSNKMLSLHRLELFPLPWLYLSAWESVVWGKRMDLTYLNPLMIYVIGQQITGDLDNLSMGGDIAVTIPPFGRLYFSLFIDEVVLFPLDQLFTAANNQFAWQAGAKIPIPWIPWLPWSMLAVQYTKIEPYTYTHYPQTLPQYTSPVDIGYTNDGENIGYHLPPNSDELLVRLSTDLGAWEISAQYQLIRHGTGDHLLGQIEGDITIPYIYNPPQTYPPKSFLNDGIYERLNILKLRVSYDIPVIRTTVWAEYALMGAVNFNYVIGNDLLTSFVGIGLRFRS